MSQPDDDYGLLSREDGQKLILALVRARRPEPVPEQDIAVLIDWAKQVRLDEALLQLVLAGELIPDVEDGVVKFGADLTRTDRPA